METWDINYIYEDFLLWIYFFNVLILWIHKLSLCNLFFRICMLVWLLTIVFYYYAFRFDFIVSHVLVCVCLLASSHHSLGSFLTSWTCMPRFWSLHRRGALRWRSSLSLGAGWLVAAPPIPDSPYWLTNFSLSSWASFCIAHIVNLILHLEVM